MASDEEIYSDFEDELDFTDFNNEDGSYPLNRNLSTSLPEGWGLHNRHTRAMWSKQIRPIISISVNEKKYLISSIYRSEGLHDTAVMYTQYKGQVLVRWLYKSGSGGSWRVSPGIEGENEISKGIGIHYTQETKISREILLLLEHLEKNGHYVLIETNLADEFNIDDLRELDSMTYVEEISGYVLQKPNLLEQFTRLAPGFCFSEVLSEGESYSNILANLDFRSKELTEFLPDFNIEPIFTYSISHTILEGEIKIEVFEASLDSKKIEWHMASDQKGRIWIDRIIFADSPINSYGIHSTVIDSGVLTSKPLEYTFLTTGLKNTASSKEYSEISSEEFSSSYVDITPLLDNLEIIKRYRIARNIYRLTNMIDLTDLDLDSTVFVPEFRVIEKIRIKK